MNRDIRNIFQHFHVQCFDYTSCNSHLFLPVFGVDIAEEGKDRSVLTVVQGDSIIEQKAFHNIEMGQLADTVCRYYDEYNSREDLRNKNSIKVFYDANGVGYGFKDAMKQRNHEFCLFPVKGSEKATDERYFNKRSECYGNLKNALLVFSFLFFLFLNDYEEINEN